MSTSINDNFSPIPQRICTACGRLSNVLFGYHCLNRFVCSDGTEPPPLSEGWCGRADHVSRICGDCLGAMHRENPPKERPVIVVDEMPGDPCRRFEYMLRQDLDANENGEQKRLERIRALYAPG